MNPLRGAAVVAAAVMLTCSCGAQISGTRTPAPADADAPVAAESVDVLRAESSTEMPLRTTPDPADGTAAAQKSATPKRQLPLVTRVVDGDTVELAGGRTVRVIGIDTPERGECGFDRATRAMTRLVQGKSVELTRGGENRDRYGRLLRYVNVGNVDAGLRLIRGRYAIARYDSRDGYGHHPRETRYVSADTATLDRSCQRPAPPRAAGAPALADSDAACAAGYDPCVPPYPGDLDCPDVNGPIRVTGSDPHGLDADGDGIACEW
jgi:endonuclease YncB( thermonuclease family)